MSTSNTVCILVGSAKVLHLRQFLTLKVNIILYRYVCYLHTKTYVPSCSGA
jgi:hypothetical protein